MINKITPHNKKNNFAVIFILYRKVLQTAQYNKNSTGQAASALEDYLTLE